MAWALPEYSRTEVNAASRIWLRQTSTDLEKTEALRVVNNWRGIHAFPLNTFQMGLRRRGEKLSGDVIVAQRIKRLSSIELKLSLRPNMKITQMQDIGGCRAILEDVDQARELVRSFKQSDLKHKLLTEDDYIASPRQSGYRGIHLVYSYNSDRSTTYNDLKIELQLRSQLQHAWATSVEVVGTMVDQALKSSLGEPGWLRFFQLMSSEIARREGQPLVPGTPPKLDDARKELLQLVNHYNPVHRLNTYSDALNYIDNASTKDRFFLLHLKPKENKLLISAFKKNASRLANEQYLDIEKGIPPESDEEAVLVSVDSLALLKRAYPNYFLDTKIFAGEVERAVKLARRI